MDRTALLFEADQLLHKSTFTKEDSARVDSLLALADQLTDRSDLRKMETARHAAELGLPAPITARPDARFRAYLTGGAETLTAEERQKMKITGERSRSIRAAESVGSGSGGGYLAPASFTDRFQTMLKLTDEIFEIAQLWESLTGNPFNYPLVDDTGAASAVVAEASASNVGPDVSFAAIQFQQTKTWRSGLVVASVELAQDSFFNLENLLASIGSVRIARGAGAAAASALLSAAIVGVTTVGTTAITADEILALEASNDPAYAAQSSWLMKRSTFLAISQLKGTSGNYMFPSDRNAAGRSMLLNYPVYFCPSLGAMTAGLKPISFGSHGLCVRRDVKNSLSVKVFMERFAELGKIGYEVYLRTDFGVPVSGANCPIHTLAMHS